MCVIKYETVMRFLLQKNTLKIYLWFFFYIACICNDIDTNQTLEILGGDI